MFIFKITYISILGIPLAIPYVALDLSICQTHDTPAKPATPPERVEPG